MTKAQKPGHLRQRTDWSSYSRRTATSPLNSSVRPMRISRAIQFFAERPISTAVLALVVTALGFAFTSSLTPPTPSYRYLPGHEYPMAVFCWGFALILACCSYPGLRGKPGGK